jgi:EAL and modified HD-GYP domain-containing signal transduction protein
VRPDRAVLQVAAYAARDDLLAVLQQLGRSGYTLALDDHDGRADVEPLLGLCSIVKVAVGERDDATLTAIMAAPKLHGARLVATGWRPARTSTAAARWASRASRATSSPSRG